jgi:activator of HSP90 ATPase
MKNSFKLSETFPVDAKTLYTGWLDSTTHSAFTGGQGAKIDPKVGGKFSAWDGYIFGTTLELDPFRRIVQTWRTTEFPADAPDSHLEIFFEDNKDGAKLTLNHTKLPEDQVEDYIQGWKDYYFKPMRDYYKKISKIVHK